MQQAPVEDERIKVLNSRLPRQGRFILYWMQQSQRADFNHALEFAVWQANEHRLPLIVVFALIEDYPEATLRHYHFMLEGLQETQQALRARGIPLVIEKGEPVRVILRHARNAALLVLDRGYLRHQKHWREQVAALARCTVLQVESDAVVPVETVSDKPEFAARTIRPKIHRHLREFLVPVTSLALQQTTGATAGLDLTNLEALTANLRCNRKVQPVSFFKGGAAEAKRHLGLFLRRSLDGYRANRMKPEMGQVSHLGKYLHFGQISPVFIALAAQRNTRGASEDNTSFLDELIIRRELAQNFVEFTPDYDEFSSLPLWARQTLERHQADRRPNTYQLHEFEAGQTHDPYWNAAMLEMKHSGYLHNAMRMYWGKKILEWSETPQQAFKTALALNNKYLLDGRDANSFANIGWIFGLHDRPWPERPIYGKVRCMTASGLKGKCGIDDYVRQVNLLVRGLEG